MTQAPARFPSIDFTEYHRQELPALMAQGRGAMAGKAAHGLKPLAFRVEGNTFTYSADVEGVSLVEGDENAAVIIGLSAAHWSDLVHDLESAPGLIYNRLLESCEGDQFQLMLWEPALRALYRGIPPYEESMADLHDRQGSPLPADKAYSLADDDEEMVDFLEAAGYLLVKSVFSEEEILRMREQAQLLRESAREGDNISWWGKNAGGEAVVTRVLKASKQPAFRSLYSDPRIARLGALPPYDLQAWGEEKVDGVTVVYKNPEMTEGLSDLPWHRDCGMGGHAITCPQTVLSIYLYDATPELGPLLFLPGSHRACVGFFDPADPAAPRGVVVDARVGDVTLHYSDVMHAAPAPTAAEGPYRQSVLLNFAPQYEQHRGGRHYNDVLLENSEDGQVEHLRKKSKRSY